MDKAENIYSLEKEILLQKKEQDKLEVLIKNTVILKRVLVKNNPDFYHRVRTNFLPGLRKRNNLSLQFNSFVVALLLSAVLYYFWDHSISLVWFYLSAFMICCATSISIFAFKYLGLQKDFDKLLESLSLAENKEDKEFFIQHIQDNMFTKCPFTREDFDLLFNNPYTKDSAIIRDGVMLEVQYFFQGYLESVNQ